LTLRCSTGTSVGEKLSNLELTAIINMVPNSFARLVKEEINITSHSFIQKTKITKVCKLFEHFNETIENVTCNLGFRSLSFLRVFKALTGISPAVYKTGRYTCIYFLHSSFLI
jgi:transcriptional regulator GlxA family with amidase domain